MSKKSKSFTNLLAAADSIQRDLSLNVPNQPHIVPILPYIVPILPHVVPILPQIVPPQQTVAPDATPQVDLEFLWPTISLLLLGSSTSLRQRCRSTILKVIGQRNPAVLAARRSPPIETSPTSTAKNPVHLFLVSLIPQILSLVQNGESEVCTEFLQIAHELSFIVPQLLSVDLQLFIEIFISLQNREIGILLLEIIYNIVIMNPELKETLTPQQLEYIFNTNLGSPLAVHFLHLFNQYAQNSRLAGACVEYYFYAEFDAEWNLLVQLLSDGLVLGVMNIPDSTDNIDKLKFANLLWTFSERHRPELSQFMLNTIKVARRWSLFGHSEIIGQTVTFLKNYCKEKIDDDLINQLKRSDIEKVDGCSTSIEFVSVPV
jgi:hypothetical protein